MKKLILIFTIILYTFVSCVNPVSVFAEKDKKADEGIVETKEKKIPASEYTLIADLSSDFFLYGQNSSKPIEPSGFAKILTAIVALENTDDIYEKITVEEDILEGYNYSNKNIGLKYGEEISIYDLLRAMLVYDAGDCAIAIAHSVGESYDGFIKLMNETAKKAGAQNSTFLHPAGFKAEGQQTTLVDLYYITKYALKDKTFSEIVDTDYIEIEPTNKHDGKRTLFNTNEFLNTYYSLDHYNPNIHGVKTYKNDEENAGVIAKYSESGNNLLIMCAKAPTEGGNNMAYDDINYLIEYAKKRFSPVTLVEDDQFMSEVEIPNSKSKSNLLLVNDGAVKVMLPNNYKQSLIKIDVLKDDNILAPIKKGDVLGKVIVYYNNKKCGEVNLLAYSDVEKSNIAHLSSKIKDFTSSVFFKVIIALLILTLILIIANKNSKKKKL